jgi:YHS domain-containing protein
MRTRSVIAVPRRLLVALAAYALAAFALAAGSQEPPGTEAGDPAIDGYSPVSYFSKGIAEVGSAEFAVRHDGRTWYLASEAQRERFLEDPSRYLPRYAEYCPYNLALGRAQPIDPTRFRIVGGQLLLFHRTEETDGLELWKRSPLSEQELMRRADSQFELLEF